MAETKRRRHRTRLERVMSAAGALPRFVLRLPFQTPLSRRLVLLTYIGRKSGRSYTIPVSYVEQGDTLLIPGGGRVEAEPRAGLASARAAARERAERPPGSDQGDA
jgi:hypothetical protein